MRRWAASFLLLLTVLLPLQPVLANAQQAAKLPACCRRNGKHHCQMVRSMARSMVHASSSAQPAVEPPPCLWKMTQVPATVATVGGTEVLESQPVTSGHVLAAPWQFFFLPIARSQATRAPPIALL